MISAIAVPVPPRVGFKFRLPVYIAGSLIAFGVFLSGCGGGGSSSDGAPIATTSALSPNNNLVNNDARSATITGEKTAFLFDELTDFNGATNRALAIDVATGQVSVFDDDDAIERFLNKQPNPQDHRLFLADKHEYVGLSHLYHNVGGQNLGDGSLMLDGVNQSDPGHFFLFGKATPAPDTPMRYQMMSRYYSSHCAQNFGSATGTLDFQSSDGAVLLSLTNDEITLELPYHLSDDGMAVSLSVNGASFTKNGVAQEIQSGTGAGHFFGPEAENSGVLFSLLQNEGLISGAAIGHSE